MKSQAGISVFSNPFLLQITLLIAIFYENNTLASALAGIGPPPPHCIFHLITGSIRGKYSPPSLAIDQGVLAQLIRRGWAIPDSSALVYAVQSLNPVTGIDLFRAIASFGFDMEDDTYRTMLPILAASSSEPEMLQQVLASFSIPRPDPDLILIAVSERKSGGADMLRYLMNQGIDVNHSKASATLRSYTTGYAGYNWSPTAACGGYGDPRARAEAEYALSTAGYTTSASGYSVGSDTALHLACQNGNLDAVRVLLDRGARKDVKDAAGRTPIQRVQQANRKEVLDMLNE